jgi:AcrR family transcriptional regulator
MTERRAGRLSKPQRREQLLAAAMAMVRDEGADALTLGALAERAGVSKPVVYEHFGTRAGLLIALYRLIDERQVKVFEAALERAPRRLPEIARLMSEAYMQCYESAGPEWHAISAALKGSDEMDAAQQELLDGYVDLYCKALAPFSDLSARELHQRCVGIVGAAEAISRAMVRGRVTPSKASQTLASFIVSGITR